MTLNRFAVVACAVVALGARAGAGGLREDRR